MKVDQKDAATHMVLSSHLQLQKEGFLSTWTNCFVGPWDPSQGLHNPGNKCNLCVIMTPINVVLRVQFLLISSTTNCSDDKIKLWLFLPGNHTSVLEKAQSAVSRLRGIFLWAQNMELFIVYSLLKIAL